MPHCPQCLTEYVDGAEVCEDCGAPLRPGPPPARALEEEELPADVKLVKVRTFGGGTARINAELAKNVLRSAGILCVLPGEVSAELLPVFDVPLLVRDEDAEEAERILREYFDSGAAASK